MKSKNKTFYVLGINAHHADSSVALCKNGQIIFAIEEERLRRLKHWAGFPSKSIIKALDYEKISLSDIDIVSVGRDPKAKFFKKLNHLIFNPSDALPILKNRIINLSKIVDIKNGLKNLKKGYPKKIEFNEHHKCHHSSAFFMSGFKNAICISIDGSGDFTTSSIATADENGIRNIITSDYPNSIGIVYSSVTQFLGFPYYGDEYKLMGLAPYGEPIYLEEVSKLIRFSESKILKISNKFFKFTGGVVDYQNGIPNVKTLYDQSEFTSLFGIEPRKKDDKILKIHKDIASSLQFYTENLIFKIINYASKILPNFSKNLCFSGGVAQNSVANGKILKRTDFKKLYIPAAGHDAGISIGTALLSSFNNNRKISLFPNYNAFLGSSYSDNEISKSFNELLDKIHFKKFKNSKELTFDAVNELKNSKVIGWFQGRCEFGPRALGNRSILADPRNSNAKDLINAKIKKRESFRPFAPSILDDKVGDFFVDYQFSPFMERVLKFKNNLSDKIPSVVHNDNSGRLQTVRQNENEHYYNLLKLFYETTGTPILVNTSFNENEPVVEHPTQAIDVLLRTDLDFLYIGTYKLSRKS